MAASISVEIPKLAVGQKVEEWRPLYEAGVSSLKEGQQLAFLPNYVDRTPGDLEIAKMASKETSLEAALDMIELLIDGPRSAFHLINDFCNVRCKTGVDWQSMFFKLKKYGTLAGLSNDLIFLRFLGMVPNGKKFYYDNESKFCKEGASLSDRDMLDLFVKIKQKLVKSETIEEIEKPKSDEYVFAAEQVPGWAKDLQEEVANIKESLNCKSESQESSSEAEAPEVFYAPSFPKKKGSKAFKSFTKDKVCFECGKSGHVRASCHKWKCPNCGGKGHGRVECPSKLQNGHKTL